MTRAQSEDPDESKYRFGRMSNKKHDFQELIDMHQPTPSFLLTIDTEGDNLWACPHSITTSNARFLPRFQSLCQRFGFKPTYLTNYEMSIDPFFVEFGRDLIRSGTGEIGMHLHAWNSPPVVPLTTDDFGYGPYLTEYPEAIMDEKIAFMTDLLEETFGVKMVSHRAGRWAFNECYARLLVKYGYTVDCSVTPGVSWRKKLGAPAGAGGSNFCGYPDGEYFLDLNNISQAGNSSLLELPVTVAFRTGLRRVTRRIVGQGIAARIANKLDPARWLRPSGTNREAMVEIVRQASRRGIPYVEFVLHSSELMPGGSPTFTDARAIESLYDDLEYLFDQASRSFAGATLMQYRERAQQRST